MKLNFGGEKIREGFTRVGLSPKADIQLDLNSDNLPFENNSIDEIRASNILEHLKEPLIFLAECYRIMKKDSIISIMVPHKDSKGAYGCMEHRWFWNEDAVNTLIHHQASSIFPHKFEHISTIVSKGRFMKWQKREITWVLKK